MPVPPPCPLMHPAQRARAAAATACGGRPGCARICPGGRGRGGQGAPDPAPGAGPAGFRGIGDVIRALSSNVRLTGADFRKCHR
eukprot:gene14862-biopygen6621